MQIKDIDIKALHEYESNPRHNENAVEAVANSIREFGFKVPIIIDKDNVIVAGHTRLKAAKLLGLDKVPCIVADDLTPEQIKAFRVADNKTAELAEWDFELLESELAELEAIDFDMSQFGFSSIEPEQDDSHGIEGDDKYTKKTEVPQYEITGEKPTISELYDKSKTDFLIDEIKQANIPKDIKTFLIEAANRHTVFNYSKIAEFYAHANETVQSLMERSALVIIDFDDAIANGYAYLSNEIAELFSEETEE